jgi:hypothetical protein
VGVTVPVEDEIAVSTGGNRGCLNKSRLKLVSLFLITQSSSPHPHPPHPTPSLSLNTLLKQLKFENTVNGLSLMPLNFENKMMPSYGCLKRLDPGTGKQLFS